MTDRTIVITTEDGKEYTCDILFTYHSEEFNKDYVLFIPRGEKQVSAAVYEEKTATEGQFSPVETEEEWQMLEGLLDDYYNNQEADEGGCSGHCSSCSGCGSEDCDCDGSCE